MEFGFYIQLFYTSIAYLCSFLIGISRGFSNFMPKHLNHHADIIELADVSWLASICVLLNPLGSLVAGILVDHFGRVTTMKLATLLCAFSWLVISTTTDRFYLFAAFFVFGVAIGMSLTCVVYVAEICSDKRRCVLLSVFIIFYSTGVMFAYLVTYFLHWRPSAWIFTAISAVIFLLLFLLPETPQWFVKLGDRERSIQVFRKFRRITAVDAEKEYEKAVENLNRHSHQETSMKHILNSWKPLAISVVFQILVQCSGCTVLLVCSSSLFESIAVHIDANQMGLYYSIAVFISSFFSPFAAIFGSRKKLVAISSALITVTLIVLMASVHYKFADLMRICLYVYVFFNIVGTITVVESLPSELFRLQVRGVMCGILQAYSTVMQGTLIKVFPGFLKATGINYVLITFTAFSIVLVFFSIFILPETKGKTFEQIQEEYFDKKPQKLGPEKCAEIGSRTDF